MAPNKQYRTPDDQGWRWESRQDGEWNQFDVGYSDQHSDGSSSEAFRGTGGITDNEREAYFDGVLAQSTDRDSSTEAFGAKGSYNVDERTGEFDLTGARYSERDENGVESPRFEVLGLSGRGDLEGPSGIGLEANGTALGFATDTARGGIASFQGSAFTGGGRTTLSGEANLFSLGFNRGSGGNESEVGFDAGLGGTYELYHGEDLDRDGYGEWGAKFPVIPNKRIKTTIENVTERLLGSPLDLSLSLRVEPEYYWDRLGDFFKRGTGTPTERISGNVQSLMMRRLDEAFARLQSLL